MVQAYKKLGIAKKPMKFQVGHFLVLFVVFSTSIPLYIHYTVHGTVNLVVACLAFFLPLNSLICLWEIGLGLHINYIKEEYEKLREKYKKNPFDAVIAFFLLEITLVSEIL